MGWWNKNSHILFGYLFCSTGANFDEVYFDLEQTKKAGLAYVTPYTPISETKLPPFSQIQATMWLQMEPCY